MLSKKEIICPESLLKSAKSKGTIKAVIVNAGKLVAMKATQEAVNANLIDPVFIGDKTTIEKCSKDLMWNISKYEITKLFTGKQY